MTTFTQAYGAQLRPRDAIERALAEAVDWLPDAHSSAFISGTIAVFEWVLGRRATTPATDEVVAPTIQALLRQEEIARAAISGHGQARGIDRAYASGIEDALMWCRWETESCS